MLGCDVIQTVDWNAQIDAYMTARCDEILASVDVPRSSLWAQIPYCEGGWQAHAEEYWYATGAIPRLGAFNDEQMDYIRLNGTMTGCEPATGEDGGWGTAVSFTLDGKCYTLTYIWEDHS